MYISSTVVTVTLAITPPKTTHEPPSRVGVRPRIPGLGLLGVGFRVPEKG